MEANFGTLTTADGLSLLTRHWPAEAASATVLIVHGLGEHSGRWDHVGSRFAEQGFDTHALDLRGHGKEELSAVDIEDFNHYLQDVELMSDRLRSPDRPLVIYGHSMGGLISLGYVVAGHPAPDLLVLSAPALSGGNVVLRTAAKLLSKVVPSFAMSGSIKGEHLSRDPEVGERYFADPQVLTKGTTRFGAELFSAMGRVTEALDQLDVPTLVIHGTDDKLVPPSASAPLAASPHVTRKLFPGFRHELHNEPDADEALDFVTGWIKERLS